MIFLYHKGDGGRCRVKLCGSWEKDNGGPVYLHELHGIKRKAVTDKGTDFRKTDRLGKEALQPEKDIPSDDGFDVVLIDGRIVPTHSIPVCTFLVSANDSVLVKKRDSVIRDNGGGKERVGAAALGTLYPADPEGMDAVWTEDSSFIIAMNRQAGGMPTRTVKLLELEGINGRIVKILRKLIEIFDRNEYHGLVRHSLNGCGW